MVAIRQTLKRILPLPVKQWIKRIVVRVAGHDPQIQDVVERTDWVFQAFEQRMERQSSELEAQKSLLQQIRAELVERSDDLFEILEQRVIQARTEIDAALRNVQSSLPGEGLIKPNEYPAFQARFRGGEDLLRQRLQPHIGMLQGRKKVLDVGCGDGLFLDMLRGAGIDAVGLDSNKDMVDLARQRGLKVIQQDILNAFENIRPEEYDAIAALHIIEHMPAVQLRRFLERCYEILPDDGMLLLEMPNISNITTLTRSYFADPTHLMPRDPRLISFVLESVGFGEVALGEINDYPMEDWFIKEFPDSSQVSMSDMTAELRQVIDACESNFSRLNKLFYVGMDVVFKATKVKVRES